MLMLVKLFERLLMRWLLRAVLKLVLSEFEVFGLRDLSSLSPSSLMLSTFS